MAAVARKWLRLQCASCGKSRIFIVKHAWRLVCSGCGREQRLATNGLAENRLTETGTAPTPLATSGSAK